MDQDTVLFLYEFARHVTSFSQCKFLFFQTPFSHSCCGIITVPPSQLEPRRSASHERQGQPHPPVSQPHPPTEESTPTQVFIKSFLFQPELPIRIDYEAKGFKTEMVSAMLCPLAAIMVGVWFGSLGHCCWDSVWLESLEQLRTHPQGTALQERVSIVSIISTVQRGS